MYRVVIGTVADHVQFDKFPPGLWPFEWWHETFWQFQYASYVKADCLRLKREWNCMHKGQVSCLHEQRSWLVSNQQDTKGMCCSGTDVAMLRWSSFGSHRSGSSVDFGTNAVLIYQLQTGVALEVAASNFVGSRLSGLWSGMLCGVMKNGWDETTRLLFETAGTRSCVWNCGRMPWCMLLWSLRRLERHLKAACSTCGAVRGLKKCNRGAYQNIVHWPAWKVTMRIDCLFSLWGINDDQLIADNEMIMRSAMGFIRLQQVWALSNSGWDDQTWFLLAHLIMFRGPREAVTLLFERKPKLGT